MNINIIIVPSVNSERLAKLKSNSILLIAIVLVYLVCNTPRCLGINTIHLVFIVFFLSSSTLFATILGLQLSMSTSLSLHQSLFFLFS